MRGAMAETIPSPETEELDDWWMIMACTCGEQFFNVTSQGIRCVDCGKTESLDDVKDWFPRETVN